MKELFFRSEMHVVLPLIELSFQSLPLYLRQEANMVVGKAASFHQRALPSPPATAFSSESGRLKFREALLAGYVEGYFLLAEQFRTQDEPAFCGLSTLVMLLNALQVDPMRVWKVLFRCCQQTFL